MGRRQQVNYCMICGCTPCECSTKARPAKVTKQPTQKSQPPPTAPVPVKRLSAPTVIRTLPPVPPVKKLESNQTDDLARALQVLADVGLMSKEDRLKYRSILKSTPVQSRAAAWRARREARK